MMRSNLFMAVLVLSVGAFSSAWADDPEPKAATTAEPTLTAPPGSSEQPTTTAAPAAKTEVPSAKPGSGKDEGTEQQKRQLLAQGYKQETHNGLTRYCRMEGQLGTRFQSKHCATAEEMDAAAQNGQDFYNSFKNYGIPKGKN